MSSEEFVCYVGERDFHEGVVVSLREEGDAVSVVLEGSEGRARHIEFKGVESLKAVSPQGMTIFAISEVKSPSLRKFVFVNHDDEGTATIEIVARDISWS